MLPFCVVVCPEMLLAMICPINSSAFHELGKMLQVPLLNLWKRRSMVLKTPTRSIHCSSLLGLPYRILTIRLAKPQKGTAMETIGLSTLLLVRSWVEICNFWAPEAGSPELKLHVSVHEFRV